MKIVNKSPHPLVILDENRDVIQTIKPEGQPIRLKESFKEDVLEGLPVPVYVKSFGSGNDSLPPRKVDTVYFVSYMVASAFPERRDFVFPGETARDENGRIIGVLSLARVPRR